MMKKIAVLAAVFGFAAAFSAHAADAKQIWNDHCAMCHGQDGKGQTMMGRRLGIKDFTDPKVQANLKDDAMTKAIKDGVKNADGKTVMKPFSSLSDDEVKGLVTYIRGLKS